MLPPVRRAGVRPAPALVALLVAALFVPLGSLALPALDGAADPARVPLSSPPTARTTDASADGPQQASTLLPGAINEQTVAVDPEADTLLTGGLPNPVPPGDADAPADIVELRVAEAQDAFRFSLKHRAYPATEAQLSEAVIFRQLDCQIAFRLNGDDATVWSAMLSGEYFLDGGDWVFFGDARVDTDTDEFSSSEYIGGLDAALVGGDHVEVVWPKEIFTYGQGFRSGGNSTELRLGDRLTDFTVYCQKWQTALVWYQDEAIASGPSGIYTVSVASRTNEIAINFGDPVIAAPMDLAVTAPNPPLAIAVGEKSRVDVTLRNLLDRKVLVNLTAEIIDETGAPLAGWTAQNTPTLTVRAYNHTQATIVVSAPADAQHRAGGYLRVRALPLGFDHAATLSREAYAVQSPTPDQNTLYFHRGPDISFCFICIAGQNAGEGVINPGATVFYLNVLPEDPDYGNEPTEASAVSLFDDAWDFAFMDLPSARPLAFDREGFIELHFSLRSSVARDVEMEAYLSANDFEIGNAATTLAVGENFNTFTLMVSVSEEHLTLPQGTTILLQTRIRETQIAIGGGTWIAGIEWNPAESRIVLPLVTVDEPEFNVTDGRALPTIGLANGTDREDYVNPGGRTAFDLVLTNQGLEQDVLTLDAAIRADGWGAAFAPGKRFDLAPGATAPVCVTIDVPDSAKEGEVVTANVTATSRIDPNVKTTTALRLIVTSGVEIPLRSCSAIAPDDLVMPLGREEKGSPGAPLALVLLGCVAALGALRRRRDV